jgi:hypothetical protein
MKNDTFIPDELFRKKVLRDVDWLVSSPLILESEGVAQLQSQMREAVTRFMERDPERLFSMLSRPEPRLPLGIWFERVFLAALQITFPFAEIRHSVSDDSGGELDFLIVESHLTTHIECAVKFFLRTPALGSGLESYVGPGGRDRLDLKFHKMRDAQLRRHVPAQYNPSGHVKKVLWMSGMIHEPLMHGAFRSPGFTVPPMSASVATGYWGTPADVMGSLQPGEELCMLPRQWWVTDLTGLSLQDFENFERFSAESTMSEAVMTARIKFDGDRSAELARGFIISR